MVKHKNNDSFKLVFSLLRGCTFCVFFWPIKIYVIFCQYDANGQKNHLILFRSPDVNEHNKAPPLGRELVSTKYRHQ